VLGARQRFPSRGSAAARSRVRAGEGPMLTPLPAEATGAFRGNGPPVQDLVGTALRELFVSMLDSPTAVRLGDNSSRPRYFGTVLPTPQVWRSPAQVNSEDQVRSGVKNAGNAPEVLNKTASNPSGPPRIAASLPARRM
jgi:hypothetical protein